MSIFGSWVQDRLLPAALLAGMLLAGAGIFWLYQLPWEALLFWALLSGVLILLAGAADFLRYRRTFRELQAALENPLYEPHLPSGRSSAQIQALLMRRQEEAARMERVAREAARQQEDYYTLWTHQAKLPVSALQLILAREPVHLPEARAQVQRLDRYLNMVLAYQRLNSESTDYHFETWNLDDSLRKIVRSFFAECRARNLTVDFEPSGFAVLSDRKWLEFVLEQLLSNAVKYASHTIHIFMEEGVLCLEDDGPGIREEDIHRIYQKGFTGSNTRLDSYASGLGLYLCSRTLRSLGHPLRMESVSGKGTRVFVDLHTDDSRLRD